jgi:hypothetical protein
LGFFFAPAPLAFALARVAGVSSWSFFAASVFDCCSGGGLRRRLAYPRLWCHPDGGAVLVVPLLFTTPTHDGSGAWAFPSLLFFLQLDLFTLPPHAPAHRDGSHSRWFWKDDPGLGLEGGGASRRPWPLRAFLWRSLTPWCGRGLGSCGFCTWPCGGHWLLY